MSQILHKKTASFFKLQKNGHVLFWLGIQHSRDDTHPQFLALKNKWNVFLKCAHSPLVVLEYLDNSTYTDSKTAIHEAGEAAYMLFLSKLAKIPATCFEPDRHHEMNYLAGLFGRERVEYYYFARAVAQWYRIIKEGSIEKYVSPFLRRDQIASEWDDFDFSVTHMAHIHKNLFGNRLKLEDKKFFLKIEDPTRKDNPLQAVVRKSGAFRDDFVIQNVKFAMRNNDIFMVYGRGHQKAHQKKIARLS